MASVVCKDGVLTAVYRRDLCAEEQSMKDDALKHLVVLLRECDYVKICFVDGTTINISFGFHEFCANDTTVFKPLFPGKTKKEICADIETTKREAMAHPSALLTKYFQGANAEDKQDLFDRFYHFWEESNQTNRTDTKIKSLPAYLRWKSIRECVSSFVKNNPSFECEFDDEDYFGDVWCSSDKKSSITIQSDACHRIADTFAKCDLVDVYCKPMDDESFFTVTLYVDKMSK